MVVMMVVMVDDDNDADGDDDDNDDAVQGMDEVTHAPKTWTETVLWTLLMPALRMPKSVGLTSRISKQFLSILKETLRTTLSGLFSTT